MTPVKDFVAKNFLLKRSLHADDDFTLAAALAPRSTSAQKIRTVYDQTRHWLRNPRANMLLPTYWEWVREKTKADADAIGLASCSVFEFAQHIGYRLDKSDTATVKEILSNGSRSSTNHDHGLIQSIVRPLHPPMDGVWQALHYSEIRHPHLKKKEPLIRGSAWIFNSKARKGEVTVLGNNTEWEGESFQIGQFIYITLRELVDEEEAAFFIAFEPSRKKMQTYGLSLSLAHGKFNFSIPVAAVKCYWRFDSDLTDALRNGQCDATKIKKALCGYWRPAELIEREPALGGILRCLDNSQSTVPFALGITRADDLEFLDLDAHSRIGA